ncbi:MAG: serine/threonine-protein phosphatase [Lachnospiraceae bacterium]|nr:serine/threonine-protein phosphatase [Lachnospiraceae bacterium]
MEYIISKKGNREINEDSYGHIVTEDKQLYLVADGCGGHSSGEVASKFVVDCLPELLFEADVSLDSIRNALNLCNVRILEEQKKHNGMRTTIVGLYTANNRFFAFNIGDSRLYQIRDGQVIFTTDDHSVPYLLYKAGIIEKNEINTHEDRNKLLEALGNKAKIKINVYELSVLKNDVFVLASDGFWEHFYESDFAGCRINSMKDWLNSKNEEIIALNDKEQDNYTAIVVGGINE